MYLTVHERAVFHQLLARCVTAIHISTMSAAASASIERCSPRSRTDHRSEQRLAKL
jgi:hypothetical protein